MPDCNHAQTIVQAHRDEKRKTVFEKVKCDWCRAEVRVTWAAADLAAHTTEGMEEAP